MFLWIWSNIQQFFLINPCLAHNGGKKVLFVLHTSNTASERLTETVTSDHCLSGSRMNLGEYVIITAGKLKCFKTQIQRGWIPWKRSSGRINHGQRLARPSFKLRLWKFHQLPVLIWKKRFTQGVLVFKFPHFHNSALSKHYDVDDGMTSVDVVIFSAHQILDSQEEKHAA